MNNITKKLRQFTAAISEQIFYYVAMAGAIFTWGYFSSGFAALAVFVVLIIFAWAISSKIEGDNNSNN